MRIGIVTQPLHGNYGGILQNYALQEVLRSLGHEPITLDFQYGFTGLTWFYMSLRRCVAVLRGRTPLSGGLTFPYAPAGRLNKKIVEFVERHINHTPPFWNCYRSNLIKKYDIEAVIVGSDQVWRPCYNPRLTDMFLGFVKQPGIRKVAYAASFGTSDWEYTLRLADKCTPLIKRLDAVSVREASGIDLARKLGADAVHVLDPTLLLGREGFEKLLPPNAGNVLAGKLCAYILDTTPEAETCLAQIAKITENSEVQRFSTDEPGMGPAEWIDTIRKSSFMVTDSFHGTVFCLLFHVPFLTIVNTDRGADRFHSLLCPLGLDNRLVPTLAGAAAKAATLSPIDWEEVEMRLSVQRVTSLGFLKTALQ